MIAIGIDPGFTGAVAAISEDGRIVVFDAPTVKVRSGRKTHTEMDPAGMVNTLKPFVFRECHVWIERVHTMPGQGIASSGRFMYGAGMWEMCVCALGIPYTFVQPERWKRAMLDGMGKEKDAARLRASQLFPSMAHAFARVKDDGRAEAVLIAEYGRRQR